jgi:hypothetical protein
MSAESWRLRCTTHLVRRAATDIDEVTGIQHDGLIADRERDLAVQDEKTLVEVVPVRRRPLAHGHWRKGDRIAVVRVLARHQVAGGVPQEPMPISFTRGNNRGGFAGHGWLLGALVRSMYQLLL